MQPEIIDTQIDDIIRENKIHRFALELQQTQDSRRKMLIKEILQILEGKSNFSTNGARDKLNKIYERFDNNALKKRWVRLTNTQKENRIKEYITRTNKEPSLENNILDNMKNNSLKNSLVDYDSKECIINNIDISKLKKIDN